MSRPATWLMREILEVSRDFEQHLGQELKVNSTDLSAMEQVLTSGPLSPTDITRRLRISSAATTTVIDRLVALGHVTRVQHPTDRRSVMVVPTADSTSRAMAAIMPMVLAIDSALDDFDDAEQKAITDYLTVVLEKYRLQVPGLAAEETTG